MQIVFTPQAKEDLEYWASSGNKKILAKIYSLINDCMKNPFKGIGKPEAPKYDFSGKWSRRISSQHRLIYEVEDSTLYIYSLRGHYQ